MQYFWWWYASLVIKLCPFSPSWYFFHFRPATNRNSRILCTSLHCFLIAYSLETIWWVNSHLLAFEKIFLRHPTVLTESIAYHALLLSSVFQRNTTVMISCKNQAPQVIFKKTHIYWIKRATQFRNKCMINTSFSFQVNFCKVGTDLHFQNRENISIWSILYTEYH